MFKRFFYLTERTFESVNPTVDSEWSELLRSYMRLRGISQSALARELQISTGVLSQWMHGALPELRSALRVAERTGLPQAQVLAAAGLQLPGADTEGRYPGFLTELLDQLTPAELAVVAHTAQGLLRVREEPGSAAAPDPVRSRRPQREART